MNCQLVCFSLLLLMHSLDFAFSDILCKDSEIDSITYANDQQMYFFTSGGHYWYVKDGSFPPNQSDAKPLPQPFTKGQAAVYVDSQSGCASYKTEGVRKGEKQIWISESIGSINKLIAYDTKTGEWGQPINYNKDHCISRAKVDWANGKPLDAMFARNYLEIFFVQGDKYAMVDCKFICNDEDGWGDGKDQQSRADFNTIDNIYGMFLKQNRDLFMFHKTVYYKLTLDSVDSKGKCKTTKSTQEMDILKEFFLITTPGECGADNPNPIPPSGDETTTPIADGDHPPEEPAEPPAGGGVITAGSGKDEESSGGSAWIIIGVIIVIVILITIAGLVFFMVRKKSDTDSEAPKGEDAGALMAAKSSMGGSPGDSKVGSKISGKADSKVTSQLSVRSKIPEKDAKSKVGKSTTGKPASAVKSSVSKK